MPTKKCKKQTYIYIYIVALYNRCKRYICVVKTEHPTDGRSVRLNKSQLNYC